MKRDVKEMIRYNPPDIPSGTLQINEAIFKFPIQEKSAHGLLGQIKIALKEVYNRGHDDGVKSANKFTPNVSIGHQPCFGSPNCYTVVFGHE